MALEIWRKIFEHGDCAYDETIHGTDVPIALAVYGLNWLMLHGLFDGRQLNTAQAGIVYLQALKASKHDTSIDSKINNALVLLSKYAPDVMADHRHKEATVATHDVEPVLA